MLNARWIQPKSGRYTWHWVSLTPNDAKSWLHLYPEYREFTKQKKVCWRRRKELLYCLYKGIYIRQCFWVCFQCQWGYVLRLTELEGRIIFIHPSVIGKDVYGSFSHKFKCFSLLAYVSIAEDSLTLPVITVHLIRNSSWSNDFCIDEDVMTRCRHPP
jgi:hypothetical protein